MMQYLLLISLHHPNAFWNKILLTTEETRNFKISLLFGTSKGHHNKFSKLSLILLKSQFNLSRLKLVYVQGCNSYYCKLGMLLYMLD